MRYDRDEYQLTRHLSPYREYRPVKMDKKTERRLAWIRLRWAVDQWMYNWAPALIIACMLVAAVVFLYQGSVV